LARHREWRERHGSGAGGQGDGRDGREERGERGEEREAREGKIVWVEKGDRLSPVRVRTGLTDGSVTELLDETLPEGSLVVVDVTSNVKPSGFSLGGGGPPGGGGPGGGGQRRSPF
jgi:HlyD family secretion protein